MHARIGDKEIIKGVSLKISSGEIHALMGPNGSGKSSLSNIIMGNPAFSVTSGDILFDGESILSKKPEERAALGLFLSFQYPAEIAGVSMANFLRIAYNNTRPRKEDRLPPFAFIPVLEKEMKLLGMSSEFSSRSVNEGFSGGEKKRAEMLQLSVLKPRIAILDETDSGLDIDALKIVSEGANRAAKEFGTGLLLITHYQRILHYVKPDFVHVFVGGKIVESGSGSLAHRLEAEGYAKYQKEDGARIKLDSSQEQ